MSGRDDSAGVWAAWAMLLAGFLVAFRPIAGMDFHWHLAMGRAYLEHGPYLETDPLSWLTPIRPPDMGAWGAQAAFAGLDRLGGVTLVRVFIGLLGGLLHLQVFRWARRRTGSVRLALLAAAFVAAAATHRLRGRPDLFSLLGVFVLVDLLTRTPRPRVTLAMFLTCAAWANLHPGVVAAPVLAATGLLGPDRRARLAQLGAVVLGACCSPRGPWTTAVIAWHTADTGPLVPEWRSPFVQPAATFWPEWVLFALAAALAALGARPKTLSLAPASRRTPLNLGGAALALTGLVAAARSVRLLYFLGIPVTWALRRRRDDLLATPGRRAAVAALAALLFAAFPLRDRLAAARACREVGLSPWTDLYEPRYPVAAADFLAARDLRGRLFHPVRWGGYLGHRLAPRLRTAHDGRITLWGRERAAELLEFDEPEARARLVERYALEILVLPPGFIPPAELASGGGRWVPVFADGVAAVYVDARGRHGRENLAAARGR